MTGKMLRLGAFGILLAATMVSAQQPSLFVVMPNLMRFDSLEKVTLDYSGGNAPVPVKVSLQNYPDRDKTFSIHDVMVAPGAQQIVRVMTKLTDLPAGSLATQNYVYVKVECRPLRFSKEAVVFLTGTKGYLFLQTDKPIYNPLSTVSIRAVSLNPDLLPANTDFTLDVLNPNQTIFKRFKGKATKGFFCKKIQLPDVTILGDWTVKASYKNNFQSAAVTSEVAFEVKEYVLPTFSVNLKTPDFILRSDDEVQVIVTSRFVYKEQVKGRLTIVFSLSKKDGSSHTIGTPRTMSDFNGEKVVALRKAEFGNLWFPDIRSRLVVDATVTEAASGSQESASDSSAMFVNSPYVISFADTQKNYKPGLPYTLKLLLKYASGELAADVSMTVTATAKQTGRQGRVNVFRSDADSEVFRSNEVGEKALTLDMPSNTEDLKIIVKTNDPNIVDAEQASKEITLYPQQTSRQNFLSIQLVNSPARIPVGNKLEVRVDFTEDVNKQVTFMVLTRGKVVSLNSIPVRGLTKHKNINITPQMSPQARLLVYYVSHGNPAEIIADSIVLDVTKTCEEELVLSHAAPNQDYRPGENVDFKITSAADSMVSLLGVDKAVYLLSERDILSRDKMFKTIMDLDLGCGPGSGANAAEVFRDAGLYVLTSAANVPTQRRTTAECPAAISRKRRSAERVRRATRSNRLIEALNKYNDQDGQCCIDGTNQQVQQDSRTCQVIAQAKGLQTVCKNAFMTCCQMERDANTPSGRSNADDDEKVNFEDIADMEIRKDFPETWIDSLITMDDDEYRMTKPLPDSITTWVISGVSVSQDAGMCVAKPINITAKKEFFVHADLPYAAIRGEQLEVKATVYNFGKRRLTADVWMSGDQSKLCYVGKDNGKTTKMRITLEPMSGLKVTFPVVPLEVGTQEITVTATTAFIGDSVIKKLLVAAEGRVRYAYISTRLDPEGIMGDAGSGGSGGGTAKVKVDIPNKRQTIEVPLKFPANAIPGTKICSVGISGSLLGPIVPSVDMNMSKMVKKPTGCGEQTMIYMGPLVYATRYMVETQTLTPQLEQIAYRHILSGFQRELTYKHPDGSYSVHPTISSSAWLTAFVAKVFCQSSQFPTVGNAVSPHAVHAINWLLNNAQNADGSFREPRSVIHREMFGQNMKNPVTFTSFVVEAISKCGDVNGVDITRGATANKLRRAVTYLERNKDTQTKPYEQAILTYALALQNSAHRFAANLKLRGMSSMDPITGMRYWRADGTVVPENTTPVWYKKKPSAYAIETASYALLTQLAIGGAAEDYFQYAGPVASWLIRQRTKTGAFVSTTDTVIGLEAVTEYATLAATRSILNMDVRVFSGKDLDQNVQLRPANAYDPFTITENLPIDGNLFIEATGSGLGQVQVECLYNSPELKGEVCTFDLKVTSEEKTVPVAELNNEIIDVEQNQVAGNGGNNANEVKVFVNEIKAEFSYIGAGSKVGMSILDVTLFTGFRPNELDLKALVRNGDIDRYEITSSSVLMYIGEVTKAEKTTVAFRSKQRQDVKDVQPAAVTIYDYYEPDQHYCTKFYHPKQGSPLLATICDKNEDGRKVCQCAASACTEFWGFKQGKRPNLKTKPQLVNDACDIYDYAVKVRAGPSVVEGAITKMEATVEQNIKAGSQVYSTGDKMQFVWNSKCENPELTDGTSYLVMGKDGTEFVDRAGRGAMRYVLDSKSFAVEWYGIGDKPRYHRALNMFATELIRDGCGQ